MFRQADVREYEPHSIRNKYPRQRYGIAPREDAFLRDQPCLKSTRDTLELYTLVRKERILSKRDTALKRRFTDSLGGVSPELEMKAETRH